MAGNPFLQNFDPDVAPDPVTPYDAPSHTEGYVGVTPPGTGPAPAPYDIAAPQDIPGVTAAATAARELAGGGEGTDTGAGFANVASPRQAATAAFLHSPQGSSGPYVTAGFPDYENTDINPGADLMTPVQGEPTYPVSNTYQPGLPQFMAGLGGAALPKVADASGSMAASAGGDYPGTTQDGITTYGTS